MIRIGTVTVSEGRKYRVLFEDTGLVSGWLSGVDPYGVSDDYPDGLPLGSRVLCLYDTGQNGDGYVLGVIA